MLRFLADENFNNGILRGLVSRKAPVDIVRVQDVGLYGADDPAVLSWAAQHGRALLTHDVRTVPDFANGRVSRGESMSGVFVARDRNLIGPVIENILLLAECSHDGEWENKVVFLPL